MDAPLAAGPILLRDPTTAPTGGGAIARFSARHLHDPRDEVFVRLTLRSAAIMTAAMALLWAASLEAGAWYWLAAAAYLALWAWLAPPVVLMLHCTMHRPFLRGGRLRTRAHAWAMSFWFGIPTGYAEHHLGMHHVEDNLPADLSSTMPYRRDSFLHFLAYFARFLFLVIVELPLYLARHRRWAMMRRALAGELVHDALVVGACLLDGRFGLVAFAAPYVGARFAMMAGNWGQHAFVNAARANDGLANSITCVNSAYNRRAFNDGYHIGHHLAAGRHWTELPRDFADNVRAYADAGAIVFEGLDFFRVSLLLWTGRWRTLARRYVRLDGPRGDEEVIALLKGRVRRFPGTRRRGDRARAPRAAESAARTSPSSA